MANILIPHTCPWPINRIVTDAHGYATSPRQSNLIPDTVFKREDGWTLAAPADLVRVAFNLWPTEWRYFWSADDGKIRRIDEFSPEYLQGQKSPAALCHFCGNYKPCDCNIERADVMGGR